LLYPTGTPTVKGSIGLSAAPDGRFYLQFENGRVIAVVKWSWRSTENAWQPRSAILNEPLAKRSQRRNEPLDHHVGMAEAKAHPKQRMTFWHRGRPDSRHQEPVAA
jgi:hypothetical protein